MTSVVTTSIDSFDGTTSTRTGEIVTFYDGRQFMDEEARKFALAEKRMALDDPDYRAMPFLKIQYPGNPYTRIERPVRFEGNDDYAPDPERWPREWAQYQNKDATPIGTPLAELKALNAGDIAHLENLHVRTIEVLEGMTDAHVMALGMGMQRFRALARAWRNTQPVVVVDTAAKDKIARLEALVAALMAKSDAEPQTLAKSRSRKAANEEPLDVELA